MRAGYWLVAICLLGFAIGLMAGAFGGNSYDGRLGIYGGGVWLLYISVFCWMKADSRERSVNPPPGAAPLIVGFFAIAIPYYLLGTRRRWHKLFSLALFSVYAVVVVSCSMAGEFLGRTIELFERAPL